MRSGARAFPGVRAQTFPHPEERLEGASRRTQDGAAEQVGANVWRVTAGAFPSNAYICGTDDGKGFVVDPGLDPQAIDAACRALGVRPRRVFCTHGHFDHLGGASHFQRVYGAEVFLHPADAKTMRSGNFLLMAMGMKERIVLPQVRPLDEQGEVEVLHTPGHTPGSCLVRWGDDLFTGDTLYARGLGLSSLPGEDHARLHESLRAVWDGIGEEVVIHPGHGPSARFGDVKRENRALLDFLRQPETAA